MKRSVCTKCNREYWAQGVRTGEVIRMKVTEGQFRDHHPTKPATTLCKKHAPPTKTHAQNAFWRGDNMPRHSHKRRVTSGVTA